MRRAVILTLLLLISGCARVEEPTGKTTGTEKLPDQEIWNGTIEISNDGRLKSVVRAGYIQVFEKKKLTRLDSGVVVDFYNDLGEHTSVLTSDKAEIDERINLFVARGNVVVTSDSGEVLRTERLYWDKDKKRIRSDTLAVLTTNVDSLRGYNFESDENLTSWSLQQPTGQTMRRKE
jgi:LPS export ABC transporter protein LptC